MCNFPKINGIPIPNDLHELTFLPKLLDKISTYIEKMADLAKSIDNIANKVTNMDPTRMHHEVENIIYRAFFIELENRPYSIKCIGAEDSETPGPTFEMRRVRWGETISNRNPACEICGENRSIDRAHIIPARLGGCNTSDNMLVLCPTHHRLYDRFMLSYNEYVTIDYTHKSEASRYYASEVILQNHKKFWAQVENGNNSPIRSFEQAGDWRIYKFVIGKLITMFTFSKCINTNSLFSVVNKNEKHILKRCLPLLIQKNFLSQDSKKEMLILYDNPDNIDELAIFCYNKLDY